MIRALLLACLLVPAAAWAQDPAEMNPLQHARSHYVYPQDIRLAKLKELGQLEGSVSKEQLDALAKEINFGRITDLVSGTLEDVPLVQALRWIVQGSESLSVAIRVTPRLAAVKVTTTFKRAPVEDALAAVLELYSDVVEANRKGPVITVRERRSAEAKPSEAVELAKPRDDAAALNRLREKAKEGEAAFRRFAASGDQGAAEEAMTKLTRALDGMTELLYDPHGPYVDPSDRDFLKPEYEGYEVELMQWGQLLHDLAKQTKDAPWRKRKK